MRLTILSFPMAAGLPQKFLKMLTRLGGPGTHCRSRNAQQLPDLPAVESHIFQQDEIPFPGIHTEQRRAHRKQGKCPRKIKFLQAGIKMGGVLLIFRFLLENIPPRDLTAELTSRSRTVPKRDRRREPFPVQRKRFSIPTALEGCASRRRH